MANGSASKHKSNTKNVSFAFKSGNYAPQMRAGGTVSVTTGGSVRRRSGSPCTAMHDRKKFKSAYAHYIQLLGFLQVPAAATPGALNFEWPIVQRTCYLKVSGNSRSHIWHALTSEKGRSHPKSVASKCPVNCFISNVNYIKCIHYCKSKTA